MLFFAELATLDNREQCSPHSAVSTISLQNHTRVRKCLYMCGVWQNLSVSVLQIGSQFVPPSHVSLIKWITFSMCYHVPSIWHMLSLILLKCRQELVVPMLRTAEFAAEGMSSCCPSWNCLQDSLIPNRMFFMI